MKKHLLLLALSMLASHAFGQQYKTAVGIKGDWSTLNVDMAQFSVKHFFSPPNAVEVNFGAGRSYVWLEGLYLYNQPMRNGFDWYAGGGVDLGYSNGRIFSPLVDGFWGGATGVFGVEHTFDFIPINVALDVGPTLRITPNFEGGFKVGFSVRYAFRG